MGLKVSSEKVGGRQRAKLDLLTGADFSGLLRKDWGCLQPPSKEPRGSSPWLGYKASYTWAVGTEGNSCGQDQEPDTDTPPPQTVTVPELQTMPDQPRQPHSQGSQQTSSLAHTQRRLVFRRLSAHKVPTHLPPSPIPADPQNAHLMPLSSALFSVPPNTLFT